jgi:phosphonoacetaldehyde hydrolase
MEKALTAKGTYSGPVKAVIFDWAGTTVDFGCCAPAAVFLEVFRRKGIKVSLEEARGPMGMHKRDHIRVMAEMPRIAAQWEARYGRRPTEDDIDGMFSEFLPLQMDAISRHADVIPGVIETVAGLRERGIKIGSTTGYNAEMMSVLVPEAKRAGYEPDVTVCVSDVPAGRPAPWMALEAAKRLGVYPMRAIVKVGDTVADIHEGLNAGMWSVGVVEHGNEVGLSRGEFESLSAAERKSRCSAARARLTDAGADFVIERTADLPDLIDKIEDCSG